MNEKKFSKFIKTFYKIFPKKDEKYIMFNNIEYILSLKQLNYEKVELSFLNPEKLMKYQKILTFSELNDLKIYELFSIRNEFSSYDDIKNALFNIIDLNQKSNQIEFKIFENSN